MPSADPIAAFSKYVLHLFERLQKVKARLARAAAEDRFNKRNQIGRVSPVPERLFEEEHCLSTRCAKFAAERIATGGAATLLAKLARLRPGAPWWPWFR